MSDNSDPNLEKRLAALEQNNPRRGPAPKRRSPLLALLIVGLVLFGGAVLYLFSRPEGEVALSRSS